MMRFQRGSMVEVLTKKKDPSGVWRCAQIVEDNGDGYTVRYYRFLGVAKEGVDKVPAEAVRPRPPPVAASVVWCVGDVVEVLDDGYWRVSVIEEVLADGDYHIQVIGSVDEFRVKKSSIRARLEWNGNRWVPLGKDVGIDGKMMSRTHHRARMQRRGDLTCLKVHEPVSLSKKRLAADDNLSADRASLECVQKRRVVNKVVEPYTVHDCYSFVGNVDMPVNLRENQCKDKVQTFEKTSRISNVSFRGQEDARLLGRTSEPDDCASSRSSVASCTIGDANFDRLASYSSASCSQNSDSLSSDAESLDREGDDEAISIGRSKLEDTLRMHEKELYSYRCTLEALYACGPLSWELETYLTNLRQKYSVSTDEHLMELKRLRSSGGLGLRCY